MIAAADAPPQVDARGVTFRLANGSGELAGVPLVADAGLPQDRLAFARTAGGHRWDLRLDRSSVDRLEYRLELRYANGRADLVPDPANPKGAPGRFGEKSVVELPGYSTPGWLLGEARVEDVPPVARRVWG